MSEPASKSSPLWFARLSKNLDNLSTSAFKNAYSDIRLEVWSSFSLVQVLSGSVYMCHHRVHFRSFQARCHVAHGTRQLMTRSNVSRDTGNYPGGGHRDIAWCAPPPMGCQCVSPIISFIDQNHLMSCLIRRLKLLQYTSCWNMFEMLNIFFCNVPLNTHSLHTLHTFTRVKITNYPVIISSNNLEEGK